MPQPARDFVPGDLRFRSRRSAYIAWLIGLAVVLIWTGFIVGAPVAKLGGFGGLSSSIYSFFSFACHQIDDRSFHIADAQFAVCSRCFGVYFGLLVGFAVYPIWRVITDIEPLPRFWLFLSLIPITIDWGLTFLGVWENTHLSRFITGLVLGFACATFIIPALVEVTRRLTITGRSATVV